MYNRYLTYLKRDICSYSSVEIVSTQPADFIYFLDMYIEKLNNFAIFSVHIEIKKNRNKQPFRQLPSEKHR